MYSNRHIQFNTEYCCLSHHHRFAAQVVAKDIVPDEQEAIKVGSGNCCDTVHFSGLIR